MKDNSLHDDLHDDDFFTEFEKTSRRWVIMNFILGLIAFILIFSLIAITLYFFLAAAGVVPPITMIPVLPYV